jgi:hypothetical protein
MQVAIMAPTIVSHQHHIATAALVSCCTDRTHTGLVVETLSLADALQHPSLMVEILRDGRVLVDRDGHWMQLRSGAQAIRERSEHERRLRGARAREAVAAFKRRAATGA